MRIPLTRMAGLLLLSLLLLLLHGGYVAADTPSLPPRVSLRWVRTHPPGPARGTRRDRRIPRDRKDWPKLPSKVQRLSEVIQRFPSAQQKDNVARIEGAMKRRLAALCDPDGEEQRPQSLRPMGPWLRSGGDVTRVPLPPLPPPFKGARADCSSRSLP